jgi:hypothetical protein
MLQDNLPLLSHIYIFLLLFDLHSVYLYHIHIYSCYSSIRKFKPTPKYDGQRLRAYSSLFSSINVWVCVHSPLLIRPSSSSHMLCVGGQQVRWSMYNYFDRKKSSALMVSVLLKNCGANFLFLFLNKKQNLDIDCLSNRWVKVLDKCHLYISRYDCI